MNKISLDLKNVTPFLNQDLWLQTKEKMEEVSRQLEGKTGLGNDFLGWLDLPSKMSESEIAEVDEAAKTIISKSEVLVVIGIGGSYLGAKAVLEALGHSFYNLLPADKRKTPEIYFAGINLSGRYMNHLLDILGDRDFSINVISKSGTTTEPAIAFRILREKLIKKYGKEEAARRIFATTSADRGALKTVSDEEGYKTFIIPDDVGGRYSVLTPVGLLPIAAAGIDISELVKGAKDAEIDFKAGFDQNICAQYAALRHVLYNSGKMIEMLVNYEPGLTFMAEWWKQLYGESEGKEGKGIFPASANFTADLHSLGQYIQEGRRHLFETVLNIVHSEEDIILKSESNDLDGLNYLAGKGINYVNGKAMEGTIMAHVDGDVPNIIINIPSFSAYHVGYLVYFFEKACALSGYLLGVNPFDQPGVEAYKSNMFKLLGKK